MFKKTRYIILLFFSIFLLFLTGCSQENTEIVLQPGVHSKHILQDYQNIDTLLMGNLTFSGENIDSQIDIKNVRVKIFNDNALLFEGLTDIENLSLKPGKKVNYSLSKSNIKNLIDDNDNVISDTLDKISLEFNADLPNSEQITCDFYIAESPVLFVSAGQGNYMHFIEKLCKRLDIDYDISLNATVEHIKSGTGFPGHTTAEETHILGPGSLLLKSGANLQNGTPYKTIVLFISYSKYQINWSGLSYEDELNRINDIIAYAKNNDIRLIGMHCETHDVKPSNPVKTEIKPASDDYGTTSDTIITDSGPSKVYITTGSPAITAYKSSGYLKIPNTLPAEEEFLIETILPHCELFIAMDNDTFTDKIKTLANTNGVDLIFADITSQLTPSVVMPNKSAQRPDTPPKPKTIYNIYSYSKDIMWVLRSIFE